MKTITGKTAFVTGAASGIGLALSKRFVKAGANVMMADNNADALAKAQSELGGNTDHVVCNVADPESVRAAATATLDRFGKVHIIVNNAGVASGGTPGKTPLEDWRWIMDINLMGVVHGVETFTPILLDQDEGGYFINTASMAGHLATDGMASYHASKFAVVGYSEALAQDFVDTDIGVSVLCPAWVKTGISEAYRNRPSASASEASGEHGAVRAIKEAVATGIDPEVVADWTLDCMLAGRMYIFTHPNFHNFLQGRFARINADYQATADDPRFADIQ